jgi:hypothetical protein
MTAESVSRQDAIASRPCYKSMHNVVSQYHNRKKLPAFQPVCRTAHDVSGGSCACLAEVELFHNCLGREGLFLPLFVPCHGVELSLECGFLPRPCWRAKANSLLNCNNRKDTQQNTVASLCMYATFATDHAVTRAQWAL